MGRYLELFKRNFDGTVSSKCKIENWPYVGFSAETKEVVFSDIDWDVVIDPEDTDGPANDEVWYKTADGKPFDENIMYTLIENEGGEYTGPKVKSNTYNAEKDVYVLKFDQDIVQWGVTYDDDTNTIIYDAFFIFDPDSNNALITQIWLPKTVYTLCYGGYFTTTIEEIRLPEGLTSIQLYGIFGNSQLETLVIPNTIKHLGYGAVYNNGNLTNIQFLGTKKQWESVVKESRVNQDGTEVHWIQPIPDIVVHCTDEDAPIV